MKWGYFAFLNNGRKYRILILRSIMCLIYLYWGGDNNLRSRGREEETGGSKQVEGKIYGYWFKNHIISFAVRIGVAT